MSGVSGLTLASGLDLGQQSVASWSTIAGDDPALFNEFSGALGSNFQRQNAIDWLSQNSNLMLTPQQAEMVAENTLGIYVGRAQSLYDRHAADALGSFGDLSSSQQTVFVDRLYNSSSSVNPKFYSYVYKGDWVSATAYLQTQAKLYSGTPLGTRLSAEAALLRH